VTLPVNTVAPWDKVTGCRPGYRLTGAGYLLE